MRHGGEESAAATRRARRFLFIKGKTRATHLSLSPSLPPYYRGTEGARGRTQYAAEWEERPRWKRRSATVSQRKMRSEQPRHNDERKGRKKLGELSRELGISRRRAPHGGRGKAKSRVRFEKRTAQREPSESGHKMGMGSASQGGKKLIILRALG